MSSPRDPSGSGGRWSDLSRPPLDGAALRAALIRPGGLWTRLEVTEVTGSTNVDLTERARSGAAAPGAVLVAEEQTAGRGRLDRQWRAPARSGLFFSVLLEPEVPAARWGWLPLLAGVATAAALSRVAAVPTALKWPNDLLVDVDGRERKFGGILAEGTETARGTNAVVIGVGLNVSLRADELPVETAGSLALAAAECLDRDPLLRAVLRSLADWYLRWSRAGGDAESSGLRAAYTKSCATFDREVRAELPDGRELVGEAVALDGDGRLVIATGEGMPRPVDAADIVHLRAGPDSV